MSGERVDEGGWCRTCQGLGWVAAPTCCGQFLRSGECCHQPMEDREPCHSCDGDCRIQPDGQGA